MKGNCDRWHPHFVESRRYLVHPQCLIDNGIRVTRHVQQPGEWVILAPGAVHWGINTGFGTKSALNWFQDDLHEWATTAMMISKAYDSVGISEKNGRRNDRTKFSWLQQWQQQQPDCEARQFKHSKGK